MQLNRIPIAVTLCVQEALDAGIAEEQGTGSGRLEVLRGSTPRLSTAAAGGEVAEERGSRHEVVDISDTEDVDEQLEASGGGNETANDVVVLDVTENPALVSDDSVIDLTDMEEVRGTWVRREVVQGARSSEALVEVLEEEGRGARSQEALGARSRTHRVLGARSRRGEVLEARSRTQGVQVVEPGSLSPLRLGARLGTCLSTPAGPSSSSVGIVDLSISSVSTPAGPSSSSVDIVDLTDSPAAPQDSQPAGQLQVD